MSNGTFTEAAVDGGLVLRHFTSRHFGQPDTAICSTVCSRRGKNEPLTWLFLGADYFEGLDLCACVDGRVDELVAVAGVAEHIVNAEHCAGLGIGADNSRCRRRYIGEAQCSLMVARYNAAQVDSELKGALMSAVEKLTEELASTSVRASLPPRPRHQSFAVTHTPDFDYTFFEGPLYANELYAYPAPRNTKGVHRGPVDTALLEALGDICGEQQPEKRHVAAARAVLR